MLCVSIKSRPEKGLVSVSSRTLEGLVSVSSRTVWQTSRSRLGLGSSGLGLGLGLDPEGLEPIPAVNTIFNSLGAHCGSAACGPIEVPFGNSRRGAAANDTGARHLTHIGSIGHVRSYVLLLRTGAKM